MQIYIQFYQKALEWNFCLVSALLNGIITKKLAIFEINFCMLRQPEYPVAPLLIRRLLT